MVLTHSGKSDKRSLLLKWVSWIGHPLLCRIVDKGLSFDPAQKVFPWLLVGQMSTHAWLWAVDNVAHLWKVPASRVGACLLFTFPSGTGLGGRAALGRRWASLVCPVVIRCLGLCIMPALKGVTHNINHWSSWGPKWSSLWLFEDAPWIRTSCAQTWNWKPEKRVALSSLQQT